MQISVCICTRNRPDELQKAIKSLEESQVPIYEIIVSDDSTDPRTRNLVSSSFPHVKYVEGHKKGLSVNRNTAIQAVTGTHILFMDDDVVLARDFFTEVGDAARKVEHMYGKKLIITGLENKNGQLIYPHDQSFLGFQNRQYKKGEGLRTIVINSTVFPVELFREILFDEQLIYGYEEVDIATRAVQKGYHILLVKEAINFHYSSVINRDYYEPYLDKSRLYATFKRYLFTERKWIKALSFIIIATVHTVLHGVKKKGLVSSFHTISGSFQYILTHIRDIKVNSRSLKDRRG
jgi:glycosyltransferase involved in cell wall biosynthesis